MKKSKTLKVRVQFDMDNELVERLDKLRQDTHVTSRASVVKSALSLYEFMYKAINNGNKIILEDKNGTKKEFLFTF